MKAESTETEMEEGILTGKNPMGKRTDQKKKEEYRSKKGKRTQNCKLGWQGQFYNKTVLGRPFGTGPWMPGWGGKVSEHKSILLQSSVLEILIWQWGARLNGAGRFGGWAIKEKPRQVPTRKYGGGMEKGGGRGNYGGRSPSLSMSLLAFVVGTFCCFIKYIKSVGSKELIHFDSF